MTAAGTTKLNLVKTLDAYRATPGVFRILKVPELRYLMIDGHGDPNTSAEFVDAVQTLYPVGYGLKFASKNELGRDYVVPPLEGLWSSPDPSVFTTARDKSRWEWTLMLLVPEWIDPSMIDTVISRVGTKKGLARLSDLRHEVLAEGECVQTLHIGPFDDEADVLSEMHDVFVPGVGRRLTGRHHEIYLSDFRRTAPHKQRTILRQPVAAPA